MSEFIEAVIKAIPMPQQGLECHLKQGPREAGFTQKVIYKT